MIYEDEDNLGYFMGAAVSSLIVCNAILPKQEREDIEAAAVNAHEGRKRDAKKCRRYAGYDGIKHRPDADFVR